MSVQWILDPPTVHLPGKIYIKASWWSLYQLVHGVVKILDLRCGNDTYSGSFTETLLRLHFHINDKVWTSSRGPVPMKLPGHNIEASSYHSIGR